MQMVIDIPEDEYQNILHTGKANFCTVNAIESGIILPKGRGKLIDAKELRQDIIAHKYSIDFCKEHNIDQSINVGMLNILLADAPTIIEADRESGDAEMDEIDFIKPKKIVGKLISVEVLDKIRDEIHATAELHEDGDYYLRDEWIDEIIDKYKVEGEEQHE